MPKAEKYIEIGVESSDDWILKNCLNKGTVFSQFENAVDRIHKKGVCVTANIGLGFPFMSERAAVRYATQAVKDSLQAGADSIVVFPYHIKKGTLLDVMYQNGLYEPVSLWSLVKMLRDFSEKDLKKIQISWYKDYFGEERSYIYRSPTTCPKCRHQVMDTLDRYRDEQDFTHIETLSHMTCDCQKEWQKRMQQQTDEIDINNVLKKYHILARIYGISKEVSERGEQVMYREFLRR